MSGSRLRVEPISSGAHALIGVIDEHANLTDLLTHAAPGRPLRLDLERVTFINSLGVRDWIRLVAKAAAAGSPLHVERVSEPMVQQFNMIIATRAGVEVRSFFAPFACDKCGREDSVCVDVDVHRAMLRELQPPPVPCPGCGERMSFNDFPERYFAFLSDAR